jgi:hypothetical protein
MRIAFTSLAGHASLSGGTPMLAAPLRGSYAGIGLRLSGAKTVLRHVSKKECSGDVQIGPVDDGARGGGCGRRSTGRGTRSAGAAARPPWCDRRAAAGSRYRWRASARPRADRHWSGPAAAATDTAPARSALPSGRTCCAADNAFAEHRRSAARRSVAGADSGCSSSSADRSSADNSSADNSSADNSSADNSSADNSSSDNSCRIGKAWDRRGGGCDADGHSP